MPTQAETPPASREELLRVIEARDAEVGLLKLMVQKLKLQLARRNRNDFGSSSERFTSLDKVPIEYRDKAARLLQMGENPSKIDW